MEEKQREEEDRLFQKFQKDRETEEKKIEEEVTDEWEKNLQLITAKYEEDMRKKKDRTSERVRRTSVSTPLDSIRFDSFRNSR